MKMKSILTLFVLTVSSLVFFACNNEENTKTKMEDSVGTGEAAGEQKEVHGSQIQPGDVTLTTPLNQAWVTAGKNTYDVKCQSCHKLTDERVVGPGWSGVTKRREPHWIMNMITNVDMMLETDPEAQKLLEQCLVRMPNQNLSKDQARQVLEFMRSNDGIK
ncbi:MAG TPA: c-type cytochrome [Flavitalea sp.]|nr:c-type cytochrome [Flavitalea sp.]